jgi:hypothetical protein
MEPHTPIMFLWHHNYWMRKSNNFIVINCGNFPIVGVNLLYPFLLMGGDGGKI